jgi:hypothetical protein
LLLSLLPLSSLLLSSLLTLLLLLVVVVLVLFRVFVAPTYWPWSVFQEVGVFVAGNDFCQTDNGLFSFVVQKIQKVKSTKILPKPPE